MKKALSVLLALSLMLSLAGITAFAEVERAQKVKIEYSTKNFREGRTYQLNEKVYPEDIPYDDVNWSSSNDSILEVDRYGEVTAYSSGVCDITCRVFVKDPDTGKSVRIGSGTVTFTVRDKQGNLPDENENKPDSTKTTTTQTTGTKTSDSNTTTSKGKLTASEVTSAVRNSLIPGTTSSATFKGYDSVPAAALKTAALEMSNGGGIVLLNFDTMNGKDVEGRLTINPISAANVAGDIKLGVYTNDSAVSKVRTKFQKFFKNKVVLIKAAQSGSYGMKVTYAVKIDSTLTSSKNLALYSYNPDTNKYYLVKDSNIWIDTSGYVHFTTNLGDYLVISSGALTLK